MRLVTTSLLQTYLANDSTNSELRALALPGDEALTSQRWLADSPPKRLIFDWLYGDLLKADRTLRILDVGGGLTSFTRELVRRHEYLLLDLLTHDRSDVAANLVASLGQGKVQAVDWFQYQPTTRFDVVIANDLFPNVDQRLVLFLERFLPQAREIRLSLTYYDAPRFYLARRVDADEVLCMLSWNGRSTREAIEPYRDRIRDERLELLTTDNESVFPNGRQVCLVKFDGFAAATAPRPLPKDKYQEQHRDSGG